MPLLRLQTSVAVPKAQRDELLVKLSETVAQGLSKPESFVMVVVDDNRLMLMGGVADPAAFVEVRSVGTISKAQIGALSESICQLIGETLTINSSRVYIHFEGVEGGNWGFDGRTF